MIALRKRGNTYHVDLRMGRVHAVRGSLGTSNKEAALRLTHRLEIACSEGPRSILWPELRTILPGPTFTRFANHVGFKETQIPTWQEFRDQFHSHMDLQVKLGQLATRTVYNYGRTLEAFGSFLQERKVTMLQQIDLAVIESFKQWRMIHIMPRENSTGLSALWLNLVHLHHVFAFALEKEYLQKNPVRPISYRRDAGRGAQPFTADELRTLEDHSKDEIQGYLFSPDGPRNDNLLFLLLRWTGFRRSDAVLLRWGEISWDEAEITHVCKKNRKKVTLPICKTLFQALDIERRRRNPHAEDPVLLDPVTGNPLSDHRLYKRIADLGHRAGLNHAYPHRFRDTFAVSLLLRDVNPYFVANLLGDRLQTVMDHYVPFVRELREKARGFLDEDPDGVSVVTPASHKNARGFYTVEPHGPA